MFLRPGKADVQKMYLQVITSAFAVKGGRSQLIVEEPLIVYNSDGSYTEELLKMYN